MVLFLFYFFNYFYFLFACVLFIILSCFIYIAVIYIYFSFVYTFIGPEDFKLTISCNVILKGISFRIIKEFIIFINVPVLFGKGYSKMYFWYNDKCDRKFRL